MLATAMVENARAAALFMNQVSPHLHLCTTRSSCLAYLQSAVLETAFAYKSKNAASSIVSASAILRALQYPFHRLTSLADEHLRFASTYGVLTDLAAFQSHSCEIRATASRARSSTLFCLRCLLGHLRQNRTFCTTAPATATLRPCCWSTCTKAKRCGRHT